MARSNPTFKHQNNRIITNQSNLTAHMGSGTLTNDLSAGIEISREKVTTLSLGALDGSTWPTADLYHPNPDVGALI